MIFYYATVSREAGAAVAAFLFGKQRNGGKFGKKR